MRRKAVGLLLLALIVVAGIVFVEYRTGRNERGEAAQDASSMRVVLGGDGPSGAKGSDSERRANAMSRQDGQRSAGPDEVVAPRASDGDRAPPVPAPPLRPRTTPPEITLACSAAGGCGSGRR